MDLKEAKLRSESNISLSFRHKDYKKTLEIKKLNLQVTTGEDMQTLIPMFELREDKKLWEQRVSLFVEPVTQITSPINDKFYGVKRIRANRSIITSDINKQELLQNAEKYFYGRMDLDFFMDNHLDQLSMIDPNAFYVVSFDPFVTGQKPNIYPLIFGCEQVHDFLYKPNGDLDFLFLSVDVQIRTENFKTKKVTDYYCLSEGNTIVYRQIDGDRNLAKNENQYEFVSANGKKFLVTTLKSGSEKVTKNETPAKRLGYINHKNNNKILDTPMRPMLSILRDIIRDKSELDLAKRCHSFPQKIMYDDSCVGEVHLSPNRTCVNGYIQGTKEVCSTCGGDGFKVHRSSQEVVKLKKPKTKEEFFPLDELIKYLVVDLDSVKFLDEQIKSNISLCERAIFSSSTTNQSGLSNNTELKTATQAIISTDEYNYVLDGWAKNRAEWFMFTLRIIGQIFDTGVEVSYSYNGKYVMESEENIVSKLKLLVEAGVSEQIIDEQENRLAKVIFDNDENALLRYNSKRTFLPFRGRGKDEVQILLDSTNVSKYSKVLYSNFVEIFEGIEMDLGIEFYRKDKVFQKTEIEKRVNELIKIIESETPNEIMGLPRNIQDNQNVE
jgi:hypothetical protein